MRLRTLVIWHKFKKLWLALLGWAVLSVLMLAFLAWSVNDYNGGLGRIQPAYQLALEGEDIQRLAIEASGVRLEIAGSVDNGKVRAYLYGADYAGQSVRLYQQGDTVYVRLAENPPTAGNFGYAGSADLTLRIVVPKQNYASIDLQTGRADVRLTNLRSDLLCVRSESGSVQLDKLDLKQAKIESQSAQIVLDNSSIHDLTLVNETGETTLIRTQLRHWHYSGGSGDLFVRQKTIKGGWQLEAAAGNITVQTSRTPYDLLCELKSARGSVHIGYSKYDWDELTAARLDQQAFQGCIGEGRHMLLIETDKGQIEVGTR